MFLCVSVCAITKVLNIIEWTLLKLQSLDLLKFFEAGEGVAAVLFFSFLYIFFLLLLLDFIYLFTRYSHGMAINEMTFI